MRQPITRGKLPTIDFDLIFFHWSRRESRNSIRKTGLVPGRLSVTSEDSWRPPFVCLSEDPHHAWNLSGRYHSDVPRFWDLWMVYAHDLEFVEIISDTYRDTGQPFVKEIRVYKRIYKRDVIWVAEREVS